MIRKRNRIDPGQLRTKLYFYNQVTIPTAHGNTITPVFNIEMWAEKNTQIQRSNFATLGGAMIDNQDVIFTMRKHPSFTPDKAMLINEVGTNNWYNIASYQPLEDPEYYVRVLAIRKDSSFNPILGT